MNKYTPHPVHQFIPVIMVLVAAGFSIAFPSFQSIIALVTVATISFMTALWISLAGKVKAEEDYWYWVGESVKRLRNAEPAIWQALGFIEPPTYAKIEIKETHGGNESEVENPFYTTKYRDVPISPAVLQTFADNILSGSKKLSEGNWAGIIPGPKFRKFQDWMEKEKLIAMVNPDAPTQGYILTEAGEDWLLQYASVAVVGVGGQSYVRKIPIRSDREMV